jgi:transglutaminase-like putative cysteine protease
MYLGSTALKYQLFDLPAGVPGVKETLKLMGRLTRAYKRHPDIRGKATALVQSLPQKSWSDEVRRLHAFVRDDIRYTRDIRGVETVQSPDVTLRLEHGDCDDKSTLLASLLEAIGHPSRFVAIGAMPGTYSHVFVETKIGDKWIPLETTEDKRAGWQPVGQSRMVHTN